MVPDLISKITKNLSFFTFSFLFQPKAKSQEENTKAVKEMIRNEYKSLGPIRCVILKLIYTLPQKKRNFNIQIFYGDPGPGSVTPGHVNQGKCSWE